MNRAMMIGLCAGAGMMFQCVIPTSASAEYLGYGNGDPGNWDYNTEQCANRTAEVLFPI